MTSLTAGEIEELKRIAALDEPSLMDLAEVCGQLPRLLSMLQPPVAADVAEARATIAEVQRDAVIGGYKLSSYANAVFTLLADHARLVGELATMTASREGYYKSAHDAQDLAERLTAENKRLRAVHEAEVGVCEQYCTVVAAQAERIKSLENIFMAAQDYREAQSRPNSEVSIFEKARMAMLLDAALKEGPRG